MKTIVGFVVAIATVVGIGGCGADAGSLGVGQILPPVRDSLPSALTSASSVTRGAIGPVGRATPSEVTTVKDRFFTSGPTDFMSRLKSVDDRLTSLASRHAESARTCVSETAQEWAITGLPDGKTFTMYFSCAETVSRGLKLYFGKNGDFSYLAELQIDATGDTPTMAVLAKVNNDSTTAEVWQVTITSDNEVNGDDSKKRSAWLYVSGNKTAKTFEAAAASTGTIGHASALTAVNPFNGVGCGVRLNVNENFIYGTGRFLDWDAATGDDCTNEAVANVCANADDLDAAAGGVGDCNGAGLNTFATGTPDMLWTNLSSKTDGIEDGYTTAKAIIEGTGIPTLTDFNTSR